MIGNGCTLGKNFFVEEGLVHGCYRSLWRQGDQCATRRRQTGRAIARTW